MTSRRIAAIVLVDPRGWLLLQERDDLAPADPDMWSMVGGGVEAGEDDLPAALRELEEETGLSGIDLEHLGEFRFWCAGCEDWMMWLCSSRSPTSPTRTSSATRVARSCSSTR
jgi:8-oxo-dGTP pyrophosphatase MutT (NUDIX family)